MLATFAKIVLIAAVLLLAGAAIFRPAALFGVDSKALANSLGGEVQHSSARCEGDGSGHWRCILSGGKHSGEEYSVATHRFGCWTGTRTGRVRASETAYRSVSGCIGLTDMFGH